MSITDKEGNMDANASFLHIHPCLMNNLQKTESLVSSTCLLPPLPRQSQTVRYKNGTLVVVHLHLQLPILVQVLRPIHHGADL